MARARTYTIVFEGISVAAVQDLLAVYCGASMGIVLHGVTIGQITGTTVQNLQISIKRLAATVTAGSAGASVTPKKNGRGNSAATVTARRNDTTPATTSGATDVLLADVFNIVNGYQFFWPQDDQPDFGLSEACVLSLNTAPSSALVMSGTLVFGEGL